ncbi:hypothetical protein [Leucobacter luti]|uniref:hypothetical protein n=1 Tax=Leucobacter luti TaxID=340320 RepID=UPI003D0574FE
MPLYCAELGRLVLERLDGAVVRNLDDAREETVGPETLSTAASAESASSENGSRGTCGRGTCVP